VPEIGLCHYAHSNDLIVYVCKDLAEIRVFSFAERYF
jgi:hypothetical protein